MSPSMLAALVIAATLIQDVEMIPGQRFKRGMSTFHALIMEFVKHNYWAVQKNLVKGCRQTLDGYCASCELLSASIADAL